MTGDNDRKSRKAIALQYDGVKAPRVTATGLDELADRIIEIARAHNVPLHEDAGLAFLLSQLELGDEIPEALYFVIAEVIAFAYMVSGKAAAYAASRNTP